MIEIKMQVDGMQCGMCETHINDAVRRAFPVKKVTSSHSKNQTVILSEKNIDEAELREVIGNTGYEVVSVSKAPYEKKGFFSFLRK
ncbi:heavy-metal-associated domain-containing protein [Muricomes intestini]|nr:heavy-metal-associated domain-containing protein [Muricomes intestini]HCR84530.1 copper resistance protein CopZ [Lachnospiraceae bacterium]